MSEQSKKILPHTHRARHKEASAEGAEGSGGADGGSWELPSVILDEAAFRQTSGSEES